MEGQYFENKESLIWKKIEELALIEGMDVNDILSDILTFLELSEEDEGAGAYFEELAEKIGIPLAEMLEYANRLKES